MSNESENDDKVQCDICEDYFSYDETVVVNARYCISNCIECVDREDADLRYMYLKDSGFRAAVWESPWRQHSDYEHIDCSDIHRVSDHNSRIRLDGLLRTP